jgi:hypothetical protein
MQVEIAYKMLVSNQILNFGTHLKGIETSFQVVQLFLKSFHFWVISLIEIFLKYLQSLKSHCIRCSHLKVDDVSALEASSKPPVRIVEDSVTELVTYAMDAVTT